MIGIMTFSLILYSIILYDFYFKNFENVEININFNEKNDSQVDLYMYCNELNKLYLKKKLNKINQIKYEKFESNQKIHNEENDKLKLLHQENLQNIFTDINNENHYIYWIYKKKFFIHKNLKAIILNLDEIYNYENNNFVNNDITYLDKFCHINKILFYIIGEIHPDTLNEIKPSFFNLNHYISPYHYRSRSLGYPQKYLDCKFTDKATNVTINKLVLDIRNSLGLSKEDFIVIISKKLGDVNDINLN